MSREVSADVDVVVPIHTVDRPVERALSSIFAGNRSKVRAIVACHNVSASGIRQAAGSFGADERVVYLEVHDSIPSPAGPINAGLDHATAEFTCLLGSDDRYEPGAIDNWLKRARAADADVVIPRVVTASGASTRTPPTRPFRANRLDGVRDRLAYRTVQLGLVRRDRFSHVRMTPGLRTGEDVVQGVSLWYSNARIALARNGPGYVIGADSDDRTSFARKPAREALLFLDAVLAPEFLASFSQAQLQAFAIKLLRTHVMDIATAALREGSHEDLRVVADASDRILGIHRDVLGILSRQESAALLELQGPARPEVLEPLLGRRYEFGRLANLLPYDLRRIGHREAPVRLLAAFALSR